MGVTTTTSTCTPLTDLARPVAILEVGLDLIQLEDEVIAEVGHVAPLPPLA